MERSAHRQLWLMEDLWKKLRPGGSFKTTRRFEIQSGYMSSGGLGRGGDGPGHFQAPCSLRIVLGCVDRPEEEAASLRWRLDSPCLHAHFEPGCYMHMMPCGVMLVLMSAQCLFADDITFVCRKHRACRHAPHEENSFPIRLRG